MSEGEIDGDELYAVVNKYASFGDHHTGTDADHNTTKWLTGLLADMGARVRLQPYEFDRWAGSSSLTLSNGTSVPHEPVFYSMTGTISTTSLDVVHVDRQVAGGSTGLDIYTEGTSSGEAFVFALNGPDEEPVQCNRVPEIRDQTPAVIIPGNWAERVGAGAELNLTADLRHAQSANVIATIGPTRGPAVIVTTPLSGWTPAAGERGTGLATALAMVADLATDHQVTFVSCTAHELDHVGLRKWLADNPVDDQRVIHLGASVAAVDDKRELAPGRMVLTTATADKRSDIQTIIGDANWSMIDRKVWAGEGATFRAAGASVLSFLGTFSHFHTCCDVPEVATSPAALLTATTTAIRAARRFLESI